MPQRAPRAPVAPRAVLARVVLAALVVVAAGLAWWRSAWSPAALDRPARLAAAGRVAEAADAYADLAAGSGPASVREEAAWRAAALTAVDLDDPLRARVRLQRYLDAWPRGPHAADALAALGELYRRRLADPAEAARWWSRAAEVAPTDPRAGRWWLEAGRALAAADLDDEALAALDRAAEHAEVAAAARIATGRLLLDRDAARAYEAFDEALTDARDDYQDDIARLGLVTALERMERRDSALAELDEAVAEGDADEALERRWRRLRAER